jgi:hypothetical protein
MNRVWIVAGMVLSLFMMMAIACSGATGGQPHPNPDYPATFTPEPQPTPDGLRQVEWTGEVIKLIDESTNERFDVLALTNAMSECTADVYGDSITYNGSNTRSAVKQCYVKRYDAHITLDGVKGVYLLWEEEYDAEEDRFIQRAYILYERRWSVFEGE